MITWFRVNASRQMGAGHLMRCLALAQALTEQRVECRFIVSPSTVPFCKERIEWLWPLHVLNEDIATPQENQWLKDNLEFSNQDILVVDGYHFDSHYFSSLQAFGVPVVLFDDNNNRGDLAVQMVINGAANATSMNYESTAPRATLCLGENFRLLRSEFRTELPQPMEQRHSIAIIMGGSDPKGLIIPLLKELQNQQNSEPTRVLVNSNYQQMDALKATISECDYAVQLVVNGADIANIFNYSKLVISAAGGTQFELLAMHTPAILLSVADNQVNATQQSQEQGWCEHFDCREFEEQKSTIIPDVIARVGALLNEPETLQQMHLRASQLADYNGVERILDAILDLSSPGASEDES